MRQTPLLQGALSKTDVLLWRIISDYYEEQGDERNRICWRNRSVCYEPILGNLLACQRMDTFGRQGRCTLDPYVIAWSRFPTALCMNLSDTRRPYGKRICRRRLCRWWPLDPTETPELRLKIISLIDALKARYE